MLRTSETERLSLQSRQSQYTATSSAAQAKIRIRNQRQQCEEQTHLLIPQLKTRRFLLANRRPHLLHILLAVILARAARLRRSNEVHVLLDHAGEFDRAAAVLVPAGRVVEVEGGAAAFAAVVVVAELGPAGDGGVGEEGQGEEGEGGFDGGHGGSFWVCWVGWA